MVNWNKSLFTSLLNCLYTINYYKGLLLYEALDLELLYLPIVSPVTRIIKHVKQQTVKFQEK